MATNLQKRYCAIVICPNNVGTINKEIAFFRVPTDIEMRNEWVKAIEAVSSTSATSGQFLLCENHFEKNLIKRQKNRTILAKGSIPTILVVNPDK